MKNLFQLLKLSFHGLYSTLGSYRFLATMAASRDFVLKGRRPCPVRIYTGWFVAKTTGMVGFLSNFEEFMYEQDLNSQNMNIL
jgi:hypothetical protein